MIGEKLYQKKSQALLFMLLYGGLALSGAALAARSAAAGARVGNAAGFMVAFGVGMFLLTLFRSRKPQVLVYDDFLEVAQGRKVECVRYRNLTAVSRPDKNRLVVTLREDGTVRNVVIWTRELEPADVERLRDFLVKIRGRSR